MRRGVSGGGLVAEMRVLLGLGFGVGLEVRDDDWGSRGLGESAGADMVGYASRGRKLEASDAVSYDIGYRCMKMSSRRWRRNRKYQVVVSVVT